MAGASGSASLHPLLQTFLPSQITELQPRAGSQQAGSCATLLALPSHLGLRPQQTQHVLASLSPSPSCCNQRGFLELSADRVPVSPHYFVYSLLLMGLSIIVFAQCGVRGDKGSRLLFKNDKRQTQGGKSSGKRAWACRATCISTILSLYQNRRCYPCRFSEVQSSENLNTGLGLTQR